MIFPFLHSHNAAIYHVKHLSTRSLQRPFLICKSMVGIVQLIIVAFVRNAHTVISRSGYVQLNKMQNLHSQDGVSSHHRNKSGTWTRSCQRGRRADRCWIHFLDCPNSTASAAIKATSEFISHYPYYQIRTKRGKCFCNPLAKSRWERDRRCGGCADSQWKRPWHFDY